MAIYDDAAPWYDRIWGSRRDYGADTRVLTDVITRHRPQAERLLDVACGTGGHLRHLSRHYHCTGVDVSARLLEVAARELGPEVDLHEADMRTLDLGRRFDVVTCLWGSIAYVEDRRALHEVAARLAQHLADGGLAIIEPWLTPETFEDPGRVTVTVDEDEQPVITVVGSVSRDGRRAHLRRLYVAATPGELATVEEHHDLGLFTPGEYLEAFAAAGLEVAWDADGLTGRGLLVGIRSSAGDGDRPIDP